MWRVFNKRNLSIKKLDKVLIANRGEIAVRVMKSANKLGIRTVAVYSDVDRDSMHVQMADEAYHIGGATSNESYLRGDRILEVCKATGAQAVHPGYGFLSENAEFADLCEDQGVTFVGPSTRAILDMGIKSRSKFIMEEANVPVIKGYHGDVQDDATLLTESKKIGFPVMLKAIMGGGGKGMRIVMNEGEFQTQLDAARREALNSCGDDRMLVEKYVQNPRHVEVQVFGDNYGEAVYLFERDCSVQRRHQKVLEEAPAPGLTEETRRKIGEAAVRAAKAVNYSGAGTVEFIMDVNQDFYFMEMNTRLQVEHPVSEMITGVDLVEWQLRIARGEKVPVSQNDLSINGHSVEARVYAEDPMNGFLPGAGKLHYLNQPDSEESVRVETGVREGDDVSQYYDPMIAKLVVWGSDRQEALDKLSKKLSEYRVVGLPTNIQFLKRVAQSAEFQGAELDTGFIARHEHKLIPEARLPSNSEVATAAMVLNYRGSIKSADPFDLLTSYKVNQSARRTTQLAFGDENYDVSLDQTGLNQFNISINGGNMIAGRINKNATGGFDAEVGGVKTPVHGFRLENEFHLFTEEGGPVEFQIPLPKYLQMTAGAAGADDAVAPMTGTVTAVQAKAGDQVQKGDLLMTIVAMKMEHAIKAPKDGVIKSVLAVVGDTVDRKALLVRYEE